MPEITENAEVTSLEGVKFEILSPEKVAPENINIPLSDKPKNEAEKTEVTPGAETKQATEEKTATETTKETVDKNEQKPSNTPTETQVEPVDLTEDDVNGILNDVSGGRIKSYNELDQIISRLKEVEENPSVLFNDPHKAKIFEFLSKYQGTDFGQGIQTYANLQQMNIESMDADSALKEVSIMESLKDGLSLKEAEQLWEDEKANKYDSKGDLGEVLKKRDAIKAKQVLSDLKKDTTVPKVDTQQEQAVAQAKQARETYLSTVESSIKNEQGQFKELKLSFSDNPEEDFTFELEDVDKVHNAMKSYDTFFQERYINNDGTYNMEQMKIDIAATYNREEILQKTFDHGVSIGAEREIKKRTNTPATNTAASNASANGATKTLEQSILERNPSLKHY